MEQELHFGWYHPELHIAVKDRWTVYLLGESPVQLHPEVYRGVLVYRAKGSSKRYSRAQIKKGLQRTPITIKVTKPSTSFPF